MHVAVNRIDQACVPTLHSAFARTASDEESQLDNFVSRSRALDLHGIAWQQVTDYPLSPATLQTLTYIQDVESHTVVFPRTIFSTRTVNDDSLGTFLTCWLYEESFHGRALARFLSAAGHPPVRTKGRLTLTDRLEAVGTTLLSTMWRDFPALHMTWGALHELTSITAYRRLAALSEHPILTELLTRIIRDESRHFAFYYAQAKERLQRPGVARITRFLLEHCWSMVGSQVRSPAEARCITHYLFSGDAGYAAIRKVDRTIQRLPGFSDVSVLESWIDNARCLEQ